MNSEPVKHPVNQRYIQEIRGLPVSILAKREFVEELLDYTPREDDVMIVGYLKTGTTWTSVIAHQIMTKGEEFPNFDDFNGKVVPYIGFTGLSVLDLQTTKKRLQKHHMPYSMLKKNPKTKIIYIYRKPEDTFVSMYHFRRNIFGELNFDEYLDDFLSGDTVYGLYFDHILSYFEHKDDGNILMVSYEKLKTRRRQEILRVAKFLDGERYNCLENDPSLMEKIMKQTSFEFMKMNMSESKLLYSKRTQIKINFFRKGEIGDGSETLTENQLQRVKELAFKKMSEDIIKEWYGESIPNPTK